MNLLPKEEIKIHPTLQPLLAEELSLPNTSIQRKIKQELIELLEKNKDLLEKINDFESTFILLNKLGSYIKVLEIIEDEDSLIQLHEDIDATLKQVAYLTAEKTNQIGNETLKPIFVPKNCEWKYSYFSETPLRNLKDKLRTGWFLTLFKSLGGKVDDGKEGSRIGLKLNGVEYTLHSHSQSTLLESGRIVSLRDFLRRANIKLSK